MRTSSGLGENSLQKFAKGDKLEQMAKDLYKDKSFFNQGLFLFDYV